MVTQRQRKFIQLMIRLRLFVVYEAMRLPNIRARRGFSWILERIKQAQAVDNLHHAPCCPANHYHRARIVFHRCTCGATREMYS